MSSFGDDFECKKIKCSGELTTTGLAKLRGDTQVDKLGVSFIPSNDPPQTTTKGFENQLYIVATDTDAQNGIWICKAITPADPGAGTPVSYDWVPLTVTVLSSSSPGA